MRENMPKTSFTFLLACILLAVFASGCARAQAKAMPVPPPLDVPPPPPRLIEPSGAEPPAPVGLIGDPVRSVPVRPPPPPAPPPQRPESAKPDPVAAEAVKPPEEPAR